MTWTKKQTIFSRISGVRVFIQPVDINRAHKSHSDDRLECFAFFFIIRWQPHINIPYRPTKKLCVYITFGWITLEASKQKSPYNVCSVRVYHFKRNHLFMLFDFFFPWLICCAVPIKGIQLPFIRRGGSWKNPSKYDKFSRKLRLLRSFDHLMSRGGCDLCRVMRCNVGVESFMRKRSIWKRCNFQV